ncbi:protein FAM177B [Thalassophryne amazonica]|uniref:protein FAM177B n=1 Tax=Thalassophryne amazonica TaxID=390379 RepID=UPI0014724149|nr:protein FAM177B [Thalassophryne amazonica]
MKNSHQEEMDIQETEFRGPSQSKQNRIIYFSNGETMEEEDSEEEEDAEEPAFREERIKPSWKNVAVLVWRASLFTCDFLGKRCASLLGLNAPKYQYVIDHQQQKTTKRLTLEGLGGGRHLSPKLDARQYGAMEEMRNPTSPQGSSHEEYEDSGGGHPNRGYQDEDDHKP